MEIDPLKNLLFPVLAALILFQTSLFCQKSAKLCFSEIISWHLKKYPRMQPADLVKLAYQAAMGNSHILKDPQKARIYLQNEFRKQTPDVTGRMIEPLSPDCSWIRVNLAPFKAASNDIQLLLQVMLDSSRKKTGGIQKFLTFCGCITAGKKIQGQWDEAEKIRIMLRKLKKKNFPPVHHSETYHRLYKPAYRVVHADTFFAAFPEFFSQL